MPAPIIRIIGAIDTAAYAQFTAELRECEAKGVKVISLELFSEGGDEYAALAFAARMRRSKCRFVGTVFGQAASAAVLIFASCQKRMMTRESWLMCHESSDEQEDMSRTKAKEVAAHMDAMEDQWAILLQQLVPLDEIDWQALHTDVDRYIDAEEALALGIAHEIV